MSLTCENPLRLRNKSFANASVMMPTRRLQQRGDSTHIEARTGKGGLPTGLLLPGDPDLANCLIIAMTPMVQEPEALSGSVRRLWESDRKLLRRG